MNSEQFQALLVEVKNNTNFNKLGASGGSKVYTGTSPVTGISATSFVARESTVVSAMAGIDANGVAVNFLTEFNISGVTLVAGIDLLIAPSGYRITGFTLSSGSIVVYS
jgi:hypothetical protein